MFPALVFRFENILKSFNDFCYGISSDQLNVCISENSVVPAVCYFKTGPLIKARKSTDLKCIVKISDNILWYVLYTGDGDEIREGVVQCYQHNNSLR